MNSLKDTCDGSQILPDLNARDYGLKICELIKICRMNGKQNKYW